MLEVQENVPFDSGIKFCGGLINPSVLAISTLDTRKFVLLIAARVALSFFLLNSFFFFPLFLGILVLSLVVSVLIFHFLFKSTKMPLILQAI